MAADQPFQLVPLFAAQRDRGGASRHGILLGLRITPSESPRSRRRNLEASVRSRDTEADDRRGRDLIEAGLSEAAGRLALWGL
jgi:hypothetical protein